MLYVKRVATRLYCGKRKRIIETFIVVFSYQDFSGELDKVEKCAKECDNNYLCKSFDDSDAFGCQLFYEKPAKQLDNTYPGRPTGHVHTYEGGLKSDLCTDDADQVLSFPHLREVSIFSTLDH